MVFVQPRIMFKEKLISNKKTLLIYIHHRFIHFICAVILKSLSVPNPKLHFEQFYAKQTQETTSLTTWTDGRFIHQIFCQQIFFFGRILLFSKIERFMAPQDLTLFVSLCLATRGRWSQLALITQYHTSGRSKC